MYFVCFIFKEKGLYSCAYLRHWLKCYSFIQVIMSLFCRWSRIYDIIIHKSHVTFCVMIPNGLQVHWSLEGFCSYIFNVSYEKPKWLLKHRTYASTFFLKKKLKREEKDVFVPQKKKKKKTRNQFFI